MMLFIKHMLQVCSLKCPNITIVLLCRTRSSIYCLS